MRHRPTSARILHDPPHPAYPEDQVARLTPRERQVLDGLIAGLGNKAIAFRLGLSPRTVEAYRAKMMTRLHARHLVDVLRLAMAAGLFAGNAADPDRRDGA